MKGDCLRIALERKRYRDRASADSADPGTEAVRSKIGDNEPDDARIDWNDRRQCLSSREPYDSMASTILRAFHASHSLGAGIYLHEIRL